jgi:hypothetical protein
MKTMDVREQGSIALLCEQADRSLRGWWLELERVLRPEIMTDLRVVLDALQEIEAIVVRPEDPAR